MKKNINSLVGFVLKIIGYTLILMIVSLIFKNTIYLDNSDYGIWCLMASIIICLLNITIKPFLVRLTIPITGITLGLFYPFINLFILKFTSLILNHHFHVYGIWFAVIASIMISFLNIIMDEFILKKISRKGDNNESGN